MKNHRKTDGRNKERDVLIYRKPLKTLVFRGFRTLYTFWRKYGKRFINNKGSSGTDS
jgi:hypothetical protein